VFKLKGVDLNSPVQIALDEYIERGDAINCSDNYGQSNMKKVDEFVHSPSDFFERHGAELLIPPNSVTFDRTFVALAAPSLEGKTQTAFTMRGANILYFPLCAASPGEGKMQKIYAAFRDHSFYLRGLALKDISNISFNDDEEVGPSATFLKEDCQNESFFVLGFLYEIVKQTAAKRQSLGLTVSDSNQLPNWMNFYARELEPFICTRITINQFLNHMRSFKEPLCLFLDEFLSKEWSVYIRNLARVVGIPCICSNTNTNIANLVSKGAEASRDEGIDHTCWSLIFRRLDNVDAQVIDISSRAESIRDHCFFDRNSRQQFDSLFDQLFYDWFYKCRPGIAVWIVEAMDKLLEDLDGSASQYLEQQERQGQYAFGNRFTLGSFLQYLCAHVADNLSNRKRRMVSRLNGQVAKLGLLTEVAHVLCSTATGATGAKLSRPFNFIQFLENHLYYLVNPTGTDLDYFPTFRPEADREGFLRVAKEVAGVLKFDDWELQLTTFREDELFTLLSCLCIKLDRSTNCILYLANRRNMISNTSIAELVNLNAIRLSGNYLEVAATMACAEASHHTGGSNPVYSLHGQDGLTWLKNVVANCCLFEKFREVELNVEDSRLEAWLKTLRIPFLSGVNHKNEMLKKLSKVPESGVFCRSIFRCPNSEGIDGRFEFSQHNQLKECSIECKNYDEPLGATEIYDLFVSAMNGKRTTDPTPPTFQNIPYLFLIFTNDVKEPKGSSKLETLCERHEINLYRITESRLVSSIQLCFHDRRWKKFANPKSVGILFEIDTINENPA
jgi:hypothetical protein